ncbi:hypothetical protein AM493_12240 [Flavobacterium akiainvivens]|uniref:VCBS repeat-containing protein n=1 Tax=Flavobacterium akiainvivens TaxID=1202724 RepID=A0A0M8MA12_9FLAO|nr:hypothetical protein [Flavobacterium akiainvivens]KOS06713.1 hypothetical protein AM493_12240 [Flavobacterium akiainvivens]SFQ71204.1 hypothetical protein SAMN05444144_11690 [Flavobacterium akiainvivens]
MKALYLLPLLLLSCKKEPAQKSETVKDTIQQEAPQPKPATVSLWDFNGDGVADDAIIVHNNLDDAHSDDGITPGSWTIKFENKTLPDLPLAGGMPTPVGEGDLNRDGAAELTIIQEPNHGCVYDLTTWSFQKGKWKQVFGPELIPTACEPVNYDALKQLIVEENGKVYSYKADLNDEGFKRIKTEVKLRN